MHSLTNLIGLEFEFMLPRDFYPEGWIESSAFCSFVRNFSSILSLFSWPLEPSGKREPPPLLNLKFAKE